MNTLVHSLLASKVSDEKSFDNLCGSPRCDILLFSCFQDSLSFESLIIMCPQCGSLWVHLTWNSLCFLMFTFMCFIKFGKFFLSLFLQIFSVSLFLSNVLWNSHDMYNCLHNGGHQLPQALFTFPQYVSFLFLKLNTFHVLSSKFSDSFFCMLRSAFESL